MANPTGAPIWYELIAPDIDAATRFYGEIVGWTTAEFPSSAGGTPYTIFEKDGVGVAGLLERTDDMPMSGWFSYFHVPDVDTAVAAATAAGATVHLAGVDLPNVGRMALLGDPQGTPFYAMTPDPSMGDGESTSFSGSLPGRCNWNELATDDHKAVLGFFGIVLGWTSNEVMPMGEHGDYTFIDAGGLRLGAAMDRQGEQPKGWTFYFHVPDIDRAAEQVDRLGGRLMMGPMDVPGGQRIVLGVDNQGNRVGFVAGERRA